MHYCSNCGDYAHDGECWWFCEDCRALYAEDCLCVNTKTNYTVRESHLHDPRMQLCPRHNIKYYPDACCSACVLENVKPPKIHKPKLFDLDVFRE